jgi:hypothetical protein
VTAKKKTGIWKDIKVYDSSNLEQWLEIALATSRWFASRVGSYPFDGMMTADEFWEEWSIGPNSFQLLPETIITGREYEQQQILEILQGPPTIKGIKASTKNEAIAFIVAVAKKFHKNECDRFFSKSLIIDTEANFRGIRINTATALNLIPRFEETQPLYSAVSKGHHVLVPLGADDIFNQETIILPTIDRNGQITSLVNSGISEEDAEKYSRESGRNITILKKLMGYPYTKSKWLETENIREIVPALLLGRWDESFTGDIELMEKLAGQKYSDYLGTLTKWKSLEETPILQIGETWRLTSPLDLWTNLSPHLTGKDLSDLNQSFSSAFAGGNPIVEPVDKNDFVARYNKKRKYSSWSREGLTQSLILVGRFGEAFRIPGFSDSQRWVDNIIFELLNKDTGQIWVSVDQELPLISEASPSAFLKAVGNSLSKEQPEIMEMFKESNNADNFLSSTSHHTGLLWALEGLAWVPEYLKDVGLNLLKLSRLDPGGRLANRPINSITEVFKPWHYQTLTPYDERMETLKFITGKEKEAGWTLLLRMLPDRQGIAHPTHKMRWRIFDKNTNLTYKNQEVWKTHSFVVELLLSLFDRSEDKFSQLINSTINLAHDDRKKVLDWAENAIPNVLQTDFKAWETVRQILNYYKSYPSRDQNISESELKRLEGLYEKLMPTDIVKRYIWLFNDHWPKFPDGFQDIESESQSRHEQQQAKIDTARTEAAIIFLRELGLNETLKLRNVVKEPWSLGDALARVITKQDEVVSVCQSLSDDKSSFRFIHSFIFRKSLIEEFDGIVRLLRELQQKGFNSKALANVLIPLKQEKQLWDFISTLQQEIQDEYWQDFYPTFYNLPVGDKIYGIKKLIEYKRFFSAIDICSHFVKEIPSDLLAEVLEKSAIEKANEDARFKIFEIEQIFETLDKRNDLGNSTLLKLEWLYLPLLDSYGSRRTPKILQEELSKNPEFFVDVLKWVYKPKDEKKLSNESHGESEEIVQNRARQAYHLLHSWKRIPGMKSSDSIDEVELREWIKRARTLAEAEDRLEAADMHIGQVLAQYPESGSKWPHEGIFGIIEEINSNSLKGNYSSAMFNKRGSSTRGPFDGGNIERAHAAYFNKLANDFKNKYPNVSEIFKRLSDGYLRDAKLMDEQAERDKLEY